MATDMTPAGRIAAVRRFNRFYTRRIGALDEGHLRSAYSLAEVRVLYELAHRDGLTATDLAAELGLDAAYLSRILRGFERRRLLAREPAAEDRRRRHLRLTDAGRAAFAPLDAGASDEVGALLRPLPARDQRRLVDAMEAIEALLDAAPATAPGPPYVLRAHRPGDMGWIVHRHGVLYAREYGYDERFEALVARVAADFIDHLDPARERCWIAERDGEIVGSVFLVRKKGSRTAAQLRLLLVEPSARGAGLGRRLVDECVDFARAAGYRSIMLWTQRSLDAARRIYRAAGFRRVRSERHELFGHTETAEVWARTL